MSLYAARSTLARINGAEILVSRGQAEHVIQDLTSLAAMTLNHEQQRAHQAALLGELAGQYGIPEMERSKPFVYRDGLAIIPVHGTLINRFNWSWSFVTGYNFIRGQMNAALDDDDVERIVFDVNSYGGEAAGCFELADEIRQARERKPMLAVIDSNACSAAYAIASGPQRMVCTPSGQAGSIGVIAMHVDFSQNLEKNGIKYTVIAEGEHKADGNPYEPLPEGVEKDIRASVSKRRGEFVELVVKNRNLDSQAVLDTESRSYRADDALELGLIDAVQTPAEAVSDFLAESGSDEPDEQEEDEHMTTTPAPDAAAQAAAIEAARVEARNTERARIQSITSCAEAQGRSALATHLATATDVDLATAQGILAAAPKDAAKTPAPKPQKAADPKEGDDDAAEGDEDGDDDAAEGDEDGDGEDANASKKPKQSAKKPRDDASRHLFFEAMDQGGTPNIGADGKGGKDKGDKSRGQRAADLAFGPRKEEGARTRH